MPQSCLPIQQVVGSHRSAGGCWGSALAKSGGNDQSKRYLPKATVAAVAPDALMNCLLVSFGPFTGFPLPPELAASLPGPLVLHNALRQNLTGFKIKDKRIARRSLSWKVMIFGHRCQQNH